MSSTKPSNELPYWPRLWVTKERSRFVRTITLIWMMWLTSNVFSWVLEFAQTTKIGSMEAAALIGAVLTPLSLLHAAVFKFYSAPSYSDKGDYDAL